MSDDTAYPLNPYHRQATIFADCETLTVVTPLYSHERHGRREAMMALQGGRPMVYAARVAGGIIKIGCSVDIYTRMSQIKGEILAFKFGDYDDERAIHATLQADLHHGREWFNPSPEVMTVINDMRDGYGLPHVAA